MISKAFVLGKLSPYRGEKIKVADRQSTNDIINEMLLAHKKYANEYDKISGYFWAGTAKATGKKIFNFLKSNIRYKIEPDSHQTIKSPAAILATSLVNDYNDCKHLSLMSAGILDSLKRSGYPISWCYRFANYKEGSRLPHHVFTVINPGTKKEVWLDAVLPTYDNRKQYINAIDKKPMALYQISGLGCDYSLGRTRKERKEKRAKKRTARRSGMECKGRTAPKILPLLVVGRKAFLTIVRLNIKNLGKRLVIAFRNPTAKLKILEKWCTLGGNAKVLTAAVAAVEKRLIRKGKLNGIGEAASGSLLASALPIITALLPLLKQFAPEGSTASAALESAENIVEELQPADNEVSGLGQEGPTNVKTLPEVVIISKKNKFPWLLVGAGIAAYALLRK